MCVFYLLVCVGYRLRSLSHGGIEYRSHNGEFSLMSRSRSQGTEVTIVTGAFSSCPMYKSYIGQTNRKRNESALLVWANGADRLSVRTGSADCSRSRDTVIHSAGRYSEESSRIHRGINNISVKSCEKHSNSVKATDIRTNVTDVETRRNIVQ